MKAVIIDKQIDVNWDDYIPLRFRHLPRVDESSTQDEMYDIIGERGDLWVFCALTRYYEQDYDKVDQQRFIYKVRV